MAFDYRGLINVFVMPQSSILLPGQDGVRARVVLTVNMDNGILPDQIGLQGGVFRNMRYQMVGPPPYVAGRVWYRPALLPASSSPESEAQRTWLLRGGLIHEKLSLYHRVARAEQFDLPEPKPNDSEDQQRLRFLRAWRSWVATHWGAEIPAPDPALGS